MLVKVHNTSDRPGQLSGDPFFWGFGALGAFRVYVLSGLGLGVGGLGFIGFKV